MYTVIRKTSPNTHGVATKEFVSVDQLVSEVYETAPSAEKQKIV